MKFLEGGMWMIDEETEEFLDEPYYEFEDGRRVSIDHVFIADYKDLDEQHKSVEKAAKDGNGEVVSINAGDDNFHFCNEKRIYKPRKKKVK